MSTTPHWPSPRRGTLSVAMMIGLMLPGATQAMDRFWDNDDGGIFTEPENWTGQNPPGEDETAVFNRPGATFTVLFDDDARNAHLQLRHGEVTFDLGGQVYELTGESVWGGPTIRVGNMEGDEGELTLVSGVLRGIEAHVGHRSGAVGQLEVGLEGVLELSEFLSLGEGGVGTLTIREGGLVTSFDGWIGPDSDAVVTGPGSNWTLEGELEVGRFDGIGTLLISEGGAVDSVQAQIGGGEGRSTATVRGPGSQWENIGQFVVSAGNNSEGRVTVDQGGHVVSGSGLIGGGSGSDGEVLIDGEDSAWHNQEQLIVGNWGAGTLEVRGGALVTSSGGRLGAIPSGSGTVTVTGDGSAWDNDGDLTIGFSGTSPTSTLTISDGGHVTSQDVSIRGADGRVVVGDNTSRWEVGGALTVGDGGTGTLTIREGAEVTSGGHASIGRGSTASGSVIVEQTGSTWENDGNLHLGGLGATGSMLVRGGGVVSNAQATVGGSSTVLVEGPGSAWTNLGWLTLISAGDDTLTVRDGGSVTSRVGEIIGSATANVTGTGASWRIEGIPSSVLHLATSSDGTLNIAGGGLFEANAVRMGTLASGRGTLTIDGPDSTMTVNGFVNVGQAGTGTVEITSGGFAESNMVVIGQLAESDGSVTLAGNPTQWEVRQTVVVGEAGEGTLSIAGGALLESAYASIGEADGGDGEVTVAGEQSEWRNTADHQFSNFVVGEAGRGTLTIRDGGLVSTEARQSRIGQETDSDGTVTVTGPGSRWQNAGPLFVGEDGTGHMTVADGAVVTNATGIIGRFAGSDGTVVVEGEASSWENDGSLFVGNFANATGQLAIRQGATVSSTAGFIADSDDTVGTITVADPGSTWTNTGDLDLGRLGEGTLAISGGATVTSGRILGAWFEDATGTITIEGDGSKWTSTGALDLGLEGTAELHIRDGGAMSVAGGATIGSADSHDHDLLIADAGSTWTIGGPQFRIDANMIVRDGAEVTSRDVFLAPRGGADVLLSGKGTTWNGTGSFTVGGDGEASLTLSDDAELNTGLFRVGGLASASLRVSSGARLETGEGVISRGTATVHGEQSLWDAGSAWVYVAGSDMGPATAPSTLTVRDGGHVRAGRLIIWDNGTVTGDGGTIDALVTNHGTFKPGASPGTLEIQGNYTQTHTGMLLIEIAGHELGEELAQLIVTGDAQLAGTLELRFIDGFAPSEDDVFEFLQVGGSLDAETLDVQIENLLPGFEYELDFSDGAYTLLALNDAQFIPEPGTAGLLAAASLWLIRRRRRPASAGAAW